MADGRRWLKFGILVVAGLAAMATRTAQAQDNEAQARDIVKQLLAQPQAVAPADTEPVKEDAATGSAPEPVGLEHANVNVSAAGTVTLNVVGLPLSTVLRVLSLETNRNIIASPNVDGTVTANLHDVTFEEALDAILISNKAAYRADGKFIYVYTQEELATLIATENPVVTRVFHLSYVTAADIETVVTPMLSPNGKMSISAEPDSGIDTTSTEAGGASLAGSDFLVITDHPEQLEAIATVIAQLDSRPRQVLVEATILTAELTENNALGVDFTVLGGVDLNMLGAASTGVQDVTLGQLPSARLEKFNSNATTDFAGSVPNGGLSIGILKDHVGLFIRALEQITDTVVLANPKVLGLNKQKAQVIVGRRDGFITTTVTETQAIQSVEFLETGTQLIFRPFIGNDGFVRMELHPEDSIGGLTAANLPFEQTTELTTNVMVKDGQTILIGGLFREVTTDTHSQVPLLGDIPVLGTAFKSRANSTRRQEVIILLTVHIVKDFDAYAKQSREEFENVERLRVGLRQGQMWHGRERLAQSLYKTALDRHAEGDDDDARWYVRMSLYNNPRSLPAVQLQEELRGRREWDDDGTATRAFIHQAIMRERGASGAMFSRPSATVMQPELLEGPTGFDDHDPTTENVHVE